MCARTRAEADGHGSSYVKQCPIEMRVSRPWSGPAQLAKKRVERVLGDPLNRIYSLASEGAAGRRGESSQMPGIDDTTLSQIERDHAAGLPSAEILDVFATQGVTLSEATLRKYVQLGLLPRSIRVGRKGKHQGSQGIYPVGVVRQILRIKQMMAESYTIDQIQREFLFMRSDLQALEQTLDGLFDKLARIVGDKKRGEATAKAVARDVTEARSLSKDLLVRLGAIESRLTSRTRIEKAVAS